MLWKKQEASSFDNFIIFVYGIIGALRDSNQML